MRLAGSWQQTVFCVCLDGDNHTFCSVTAADGRRVHCLICDIHLQPKKGELEGVWWWWVGGGGDIRAESQQTVGG